MTRQVDWSAAGFGSAARSGPEFVPRRCRSSLKARPSTSSRSRVPPPTPPRGTLSLLLILPIVIVLLVVGDLENCSATPQARAGVVERAPAAATAHASTPGLTSAILFCSSRRLPLILRQQLVLFDLEQLGDHRGHPRRQHRQMATISRPPTRASHRRDRYANAIDLLAVTTFFNVIWAWTPQETLSVPRRSTYQSGTRPGDGKAGIRIHRVELKSVDPPSSIRT